MAPSTVLLARPHPSIVGAMSRFLANAGYVPRSLTSLDELAKWNPKDVAAIVVSTSVSSAVQGSFDEVVRQAVTRLPGVPLVFATVVEAEHARRVLSDTLDARGIPVCIHTVGEQSRPASGPENGPAALLLNRHDLEDEAHHRRAAAAFEALMDRRLA